MKVAVSDSVAAPALPFWRTLGGAAHRPLFLAGAFQAVLTMLWWGADLESRLAGWPALPSPLIAPAAAHAWLILYGFFPVFMFGFLFTALPNWVNGRPIVRRTYLTTGLAMAIGAALFYPALYLPGLMPFAVLLHGLGWAVGLLALFRALRLSPAGDKRQPWVCVLAVLAGWLGALAFLLWLTFGEPVWLRLAEKLAVWGFLTPLMLAVCHRMIPFFTSRVVANYVVVRPYRPLWVMLAACLAHAALEVAERPHWTWPGDLLMSGLSFWFIAHWGIAHAFKVRLLAMLHVAFVWTGLAFLLFGLDSLGGFLELGGLGLAPLHTRGIGFFAAMLVGMASRVSLGHSGRPLEADGYTWALFWLVQAAALPRLLPELFPGIMPYRLVSLAALLWLIAFGAWTWKFAPYYWRPRVDGKPG